MDEAGVTIPDFAEIRDEGRRQAAARREAFAAAQARAASRSQEEIREIYVAELRSRGLRIPANPVVDAVVERINGNPRQPRS
jgi:hypothetical protein